MDGIAQGDSTKERDISRNAGSCLFRSIRPSNTRTRTGSGIQVEAELKGSPPGGAPLLTSINVSHPKGHIPFLDGIRGIAILGVFLFHSLSVGFGADQLSWHGLFRDFNTSRSFLALYPLTYGWAGVAIFFVVSGFCIHLSYQQSKDKEWLNFCSRRFFRLYPAYLLAIAIFFFLWPWGSFSIHSFSRLAQFGTHVLAVHNLDRRTYFGINPGFWSIAVEIQLYAIYPLLLFIIRKKGWWNAVLVSAGFEVVIQFAQSISSTVLNKPLPLFITLSPFAFWFSWSIGAYLAQCFLEGRSTRLSRLRFDVVAATAFALPLFKPTEGFAFLAFALLTGIAIDRLISERWEIPKHKVCHIAWAHLSFLGVISYSFYLFHQPVIGLTWKVLHGLFPQMYFHPLTKLVICCFAWYPIILLLSYCVYRTVEQPSIALGKVAWKKFKESNMTTRTIDISAQANASPEAILSQCKAIVETLTAENLREKKNKLLALLN